MATTKTEKPRKSPSGSYMSNKARAEKGRVRLEAWMEADDAVLFEEVCVARGLSKKEAVALIIQTAAPLLLGTK